MFRIDDPSAAPSLPTPAAAGTPGYFTEGNPGTGVPATRVRADWLNQFQEEFMSVLAAASVAPNKTVNNQLLTSIQALIKTLAIGFNQAWQDVSASRAVNTTFTNSTGRSIMICCGGTTSGASGGYSIQVNGVVADQKNTVAGEYFTLKTVIPPGATYTLSKGGADTFSSLFWAELR